MTQAQPQPPANEASLEEAAPDVESDPSKLILPYVDSSMKVYQGLNVEELALFLPVGVLAVATFAAFLFVGRLIGYLGLVAALGALSAAKWAVSSTEWYEVPRERVRNRLAYRSIRRRLPWGHEEALDVPGLRKVGREGCVQRHDGRWLALVRLDELVADRLTDRSRAEVVQALRRGIDTELDDSWWAYYATSRPSTTTDLAAHRDARTRNDDGGRTPCQQEVLADAAEWLRAQDGWRENVAAAERASIGETEWQANEMRHYIVVDAHRFEQNVNPLGASLLAALPGGVRGLLARLPGVADHREEDVASADDTSAAADEEVPSAPTDALADVSILEADTDGLAVGDGRDVRETLSARVESVIGAISEMSGVQARRAGRREHVDVAYAYWSGDDRHVPEHRLGDPLLRAYEWDEDDTGYSPMERMVAPEQYDVIDRTVQTGSRVARTFWIAEWPTTPDGLFLRDLTALTDIDLDVKLYCEPYADAQADLEHLVPEVDAERMDRKDRGEISSMRVEDIEEAYKLAFLLLEHTNVTAWRLNGYVTVRADSVTQLEERCERVIRTLKDHPANCALVASGTRQHEQFASGGAFATDQFDNVTMQNKSRIALSGGLAAAVSPVALRLQE